MDVDRVDRAGWFRGDGSPVDASGRPPRREDPGVRPTPSAGRRPKILALLKEAGASGLRRSDLYPKMGARRKSDLDEALAGLIADGLVGATTLATGGRTATLYRATLKAHFTGP